VCSVCQAMNSRPKSAAINLAEANVCVRFPVVGQELDEISRSHARDLRQEEWKDSLQATGILTWSKRNPCSRLSAWLTDIYGGPN
jgi:hypothetical protein